MMRTGQRSQPMLIRKLHAQASTNTTERNSITDADGPCVVIDGAHQIVDVYLEGLRRARDQRQCSNTSVVLGRHKQFTVFEGLHQKRDLRGWMVESIMIKGHDFFPSCKRNARSADSK